MSFKTTRIALLVGSMWLVAGWSSPLLAEGKSPKGGKPAAKTEQKAAKHDVKAHKADVKADVKVHKTEAKAGAKIDTAHAKAGTQGHKAGAKAVKRERKAEVKDLKQDVKQAKKDIKTLEKIDKERNRVVIVEHIRRQGMPRGFVVRPVPATVKMKVKEGVLLVPEVRRQLVVVPSAFATELPELPPHWTRYFVGNDLIVVDGDNRIRAVVPNVLATDIRATTGNVMMLERIDKQHDRVVIVEHLRHEGLPQVLVRRRALPADLRAQLREGVVLAPALRPYMIVVPQPLVADLAAPPYYRRYFVGDDLVVIDTRKNVVAAVIADILRGF